MIPTPKVGSIIAEVGKTINQLQVKESVFQYTEAPKYY